MDQRTPHFALPLPHPENDLETDLPRLRATITMVDAELAALTQRVDALRADLDTLTALTVSAL